MDDKHNHDQLPDLDVKNKEKTYVFSSSDRMQNNHNSNDDTAIVGHATSIVTQNESVNISTTPKYTYPHDKTSYYDSIIKTMMTAPANKSYHLEAEPSRAHYTSYIDRRSGNDQTTVSVESAALGACHLISMVILFIIIYLIFRVGVGNKHMYVITAYVLILLMVATYVPQFGLDIIDCQMNKCMGFSTINVDNGYKCQHPVVSKLSQEIYQIQKANNATILNKIYNHLSTVQLCLRLMYLANFWEFLDAIRCCLDLKHCRLCHGQYLPSGIIGIILEYLCNDVFVNVDTNLIRYYVVSAEGRSKLDHAAYLWHFNCMQQWAALIDRIDPDSSLFPNIKIECEP